MTNGTYITFAGQTLSIAAWARKYGIRPGTLARRLSRGIPLKDALFAPLHAPKKIVTPAGERTVKEIARAVKVGIHAIYARRRRGWKKNELAAQPMRRTKLTAFGRTQTISEWIRETGLTKSTIHTRLRRGWDVEKALSTPQYSNGYRSTCRVITAFGKTQTVTEWARCQGLNVLTLRSRLRSGVAVEVALTAPVVKYETKVK